MDTSTPKGKRYSLRYTHPQETDPIWYDSLGDLYLALENVPDVFCEVTREDNKETYQGAVTIVKANIAWVLLNIKFENQLPSGPLGDHMAELETDLKKDRPTT